MMGEHTQKTEQNHPYLSLGTGYFLHATNHTQYQGVFARHDTTLFKYIDTLQIESDIHTVEYRPGAVNLHTDDGKVTIEQSLSGLRVAATTTTNIGIVLDMRYIHDYDTEGRIYDVSNDDTTTITYTKYESDRCETQSYTASLQIDTASWTTTRDWQPKTYTYDERRGIKSNFWVYHAGTMRISPNRPAHIHIPLSQNDQTIPIIDDYGYEDNGHSRIAAGYPWFYQAWSRDEIISLEPVIEHAPGLASDILVSAARRGQGAQSVEGSSLASADTPGWIAKRSNQLRQRADVLDQEACDEIASYLRRRWEAIETTDDLVRNEANETWMDTAGGTDDNRRGLRVEIQAGWLEALSFVSENVDNSEPFESSYTALREAVRSHLVKGDVVYDGREDGVLDWRRRPNIFLAYYLHPDMLPDKIWKQSFDRVLDACWLDWGGLSSIGTEDALFCDYHTGADNRSYHRGDSWYYVNNIAAIAMHDLDHEAYLQYIEHIRRASRRDREKLGAIGTCSEISSAAEQTSDGCFSQAWSKATLHELNRLLRQAQLS